jgi:16S rRNA (guanine966-N2)-methyltransferase
MKLRIIAGSLGRRYLTIDKQARGDFRPTQERVRQAIAETIKMSIGDAVVADLCAGSGAFGFEMASRGAETVHFVESDRERARCITKHIELFGIQSMCSVFTADAQRFVATCRQAYDIIFFDPPYDNSGLAALAGWLPGLLSEKGILIYERGISGVPPAALFPGVGFARNTRTYGDTAVEFISRL